MNKLIDALAEQMATSLLNDSGEACDAPAERGPAGTPYASKLQIAILDRGWVFVGECSYDGPFLHIKGARCVRKWGTTKGLGQLASEGPLPETVLDSCPDLCAGSGSVVALIACNESSWK